MVTTLSCLYFACWNLSCFHRNNFTVYQDSLKFTFCLPGINNAVQFVTCTDFVCAYLNQYLRSSVETRMNPVYESWYMTYWDLKLSPWELELSVKLDLHSDNWLEEKEAVKSSFQTHLGWLNELVGYIPSVCLSVAFIVRSKVDQRPWWIVELRRGRLLFLSF